MIYVLFTADGQTKLPFQVLNILQMKLQQAVARMMQIVREPLAMVMETPI